MKIMKVMNFRESQLRLLGFKFYKMEHLYLERLAPDFKSGSHEFICKYLSLVVFIFFFPTLVFCQSSLLQMNYETHAYFESSVYSQENCHPSIRPFLVSDINSYQSIIGKMKFQAVQKWDNRLLNKDLFEIKREKFTINASPFVSYIRKAERQVKSDAYFDMGLNLNGTIGKKIAYAANFFSINEIISERYKNIVNNAGIVPHFGKYENRYQDQFTVTGFSGYLSWSPNKTFNFQLGKGKNFLGDGYRSLFLSDNATAYPYFRLSAKIWNLQYINLTMRLNDIDYGSNSKDLKGKYAVVHYLSWNVTKRFNLSVFEAVTWNERDSIGFRGFEANYLNPVVFFRPVEFSMGSPDNELLGISGRLRLFRSFHLYGQFFIDEFILRHIKARDEWWGNKFGLQAGFRYFEPLRVKGLMLQAEYNFVRPYTYSHESSMQNYGNYYQPLAHPLGANFDEYIFIARYNLKRVIVMGKANYSEKGFDKTNDPFIYGGDIYKPYTSLRLSDATGMKMKQGDLQRFFQAEAKLSVMINPKMNFYAEVALIYRNIKTTTSESDQTYINFGVRTNLFNNYFDF
jgi:hypothetical protein